MNKLGSVRDGILMPTYDLNGLGEKEFERMCKSLLKKVIGSGTITFGEGPDGGREAVFQGKAPYPSESEQWDGHWIFQVKFHNTRLVSGSEARNRVLADLQSELNKIVIRYKRRCDNYILITNVPLSSVSGRGTHDLIAQAISRFQRLRQQVYHVPSNIHVWGADEIYGFLESHPTIRCSYLQFVTPGDLIAQLMRGGSTAPSQLAETVKLYVSTCLYREQYAQLDQAGEIGEERLLLQKVFIDLDVVPRELNYKIGAYHLEGALRFDEMIQAPLTMPVAKDEQLTRILSKQTRYAQLHKYPVHTKDTLFVTDFLAMELPILTAKEPPTISAMETILAEKEKKIVLLGGPGQGKSTLGQYLAQIHRATLLGQLDRIHNDPKLTPLVVRVPFRVILREYAQWIMDLEDKEKDAFELYLAHKMMERTGRDITGQDIQTVFKTNPCLLVLDGLDEVTDLQLRIRVLDRIAEFLLRCEKTLEADVQVLATSRPTGYSDYFNPNEYLHLSLTNVSRAKVVEYVRRWVTAKLLEEEKVRTLEKTIAECLDDPQIQFLMNTPLQVTILILIILSGGTPPKQREALFDEYLEVIYKREKAKAKWIIETEKQLLFGLHRYLGYVMQSRAGGNQNIRSTLSEDEFKKEVLHYLRFNDPYSTQEKLNSSVKRIVNEAKERLVLIVEMEPGMFGFELRSIQEFFAAGHLTDTAKDSTQRYERFEAIARLPHWRNVALFFAGRVGRLYGGEAANIIEVCRHIDRQPPDNFLRRGAWLGLELAADRCFGPNRNLQRTMIEYCLSMLDDDLSIARYGIIDILRKLSSEDISDHLQPVLREKLFKIHPASLGSVMDIYYSTVHSTDELLERLNSRLESQDLEDVIWSLSKCLQFRAPPLWLSQRLPRIVPRLSPSTFAQIFARHCFDDTGYIKACLQPSVLTDLQIEALLDVLFANFFEWSANVRNNFPQEIQNTLTSKKEQLWLTISLLRSLGLILNSAISKKAVERSENKPSADHSINNKLAEKIMSTIAHAEGEHQDVLPHLRLCSWVLVLMSLPASRMLLPDFAKFFKQTSEKAVWATDFLLSWAKRLSDVRPFLLIFLIRLERSTSTEDTSNLIRWVTEVSRAKSHVVARMMSKMNSRALTGKDVLSILSSIQKLIVEKKNYAQALAVTSSLLCEEWNMDDQISQVVDHIIRSVASIRSSDSQSQYQILILLFLRRLRTRRPTEQTMRLALQTMGETEIKIPIPLAHGSTLLENALLADIGSYIGCDEPNLSLGAVKLISALTQYQVKSSPSFPQVELDTVRDTMKRLIETNPNMRVAGIRVLGLSLPDASKESDWATHQMEKCESQEEAMAWTFLINSLQPGGDVATIPHFPKFLLAILNDLEIPLSIRHAALQGLGKIVTAQDSSLKIEETKLSLPLWK